MSTLKKIAQHLNLTPTAVSYVLTGRIDKVSPATRERVLAAAREMGYQPHPAARALRTGRTHTVAVLTRPPEAPYYSQVLHFLVQQALAHPYRVLIQQVRWTEAGGADAPLATAGVDGIFLVDTPRASLKLGSPLPKRLAPMISLGAFYDDTCDYVGIDLTAGARDAVTHLVAIGCRRVAYMYDLATSAAPEVRREAYLAALSDVGLTPEMLIVPEQTRTQAYHFMREYVQRNGCPDGLFCISDEMAIGAHRALRDLGFRVPEDVALIGCDGIPEAEYSNPSLTTIVQPVEQMCRQAWEMFERRLLDPEAPPQRELLTAKLAVRASAQRVPSSP